MANMKHGIKESWIVIRFGELERNPSWIVERFGKYGRKLWNDMENTEEDSEKFPKYGRKISWIVVIYRN